MIAHPRRAMKISSVAWLGNYVVPEDRLTLRESTYERSFLEGLRAKWALARWSDLERAVGFSFQHGVEMEGFTPVERAVVATMLAMLRPSLVVVLDDADLLVPTAQQQLLYEIKDGMGDAAAGAGKLSDGLGQVTSSSRNYTRKSVPRQVV